jgi:hypothetical protein
MTLSESSPQINFLSNLNSSISQIISECSNFDEAIDINSYHTAINDIDAMLQSLKELRVRLENNQFDFECEGSDSVEIEIYYDYSLNRADENYVWYDFNYSGDSGTVRINKETIIEYLESDRNIESLIVDGINEKITDRLS